MDENTRASYLADLDFFQSKLEETADSNLYFPVAVISARLGEYDEVIAICNEALKTTPDFLQIRVLLTDAYINVGRKDEAKEMLYEILTADEDNYKALKLMGMIYKSDGDIENALRFFRTAYLKAPEDTELFGWLDEMGGFPISGTSGQITEDTSEFGDFDTDFIFSIDMDSTLESAKAAIDDLMREVSGKGSTENKEKEEKHFDAFSGKEISDDEILNALGLSGAETLDDAAADDIDTDTGTYTGTDIDTGIDTGIRIAEKLPDAEELPAPPEFMDLASFPGFNINDTGETLPEELIGSVAQEASADDAGLSAFIAAASDFSPVSPKAPVNGDNDEIDKLLDKALAEAAKEFAVNTEAMPVAAPAPPDEPVVIPDIFDDGAAPVRPAGIIESGGIYGFDDIDDDDDYGDDDDLSFESLAKLAPLDMPDAPVESAALPPLDSPIAPEDVVADIAGEDEFAKALSSFDKLEGDSPVPMLEEDERLVPFVPEGLVDEVFAESGLDAGNPYLDDEPINLDALVGNKEEGVGAEESVETESPAEDEFAEDDKIIDLDTLADEIIEDEIIDENIHDDGKEGV